MSIALSMNKTTAQEAGCLDYVTVHTDGSYTINGIGKKSYGSANKGYLYCRVCGYRAAVHRLVALVYLPNPDNLPFVMHKDDDPFNNCVDNLQWGTAADNNTMCVEHNRKVTRAVVCYGLNGRLVARYASIVEASKATGVPSSSIVLCCKGSYKTAGGYKWTYCRLS